MFSPGIFILISFDLPNTMSCTRICMDLKECLKIEKTDSGTSSNLTLSSSWTVLSHPYQRLPSAYKGYPVFFGSLFTALRHTLIRVSGTGTLDSMKGGCLGMCGRAIWGMRTFARCGWLPGKLHMSLCQDPHSIKPKRIQTKLPPRNQRSLRVFPVRSQCHSSPSKYKYLLYV